MKLKRVVYEPGSLHIHTEISIKDGVDICSYSGVKISRILAENVKRQIMLLDDAIVAICTIEDSLYLKPWKEITEERYNEMLGVLPPEKWKTVSGVSIFRMSEYITSNITAHFVARKASPTCGYGCSDMEYFTAYRRTTWDYNNVVKELKEVTSQ